MKINNRKTLELATDFVKEVEGDKYKPKKASLFTKLKNIPKNLKDLAKQRSELKIKIDSGKATLKDKMDYRSINSKLKQVAIQAGISTAQLALITLGTTLTGGAGTGAAVIGAKMAFGGVAGLSATGYISAGKAVATSGTLKGNNKIINKINSGKKLNVLENYKVVQAKKIK